MTSSSSISSSHVILKGWMIKTIQSIERRETGTKLFQASVSSVDMTVMLKGNYLPRYSINRQKNLSDSEYFLSVTPSTLLFILIPSIHPQLSTTTTTVHESTEMDPTPLQIREKWLRLTIAMSKDTFDPYDPDDPPREVRNLMLLKHRLSDKVMPAWPGLIGWYGLHSGKSNKCAIILRFSAYSMRGKSRLEVFQQVRGHFHDKVCDEVKIVDYGDASVDMVPRMADYSHWQPFGILPPELSCLYTE